MSLTVAVFSLGDKLLGNCVGWLGIYYSICFLMCVQRGIHVCRYVGTCVHWEGTESDVLYLFHSVDFIS